LVQCSGGCRQPREPCPVVLRTTASAPRVRINYWRFGQVSECSVLVSVANSMSIAR
jgi:hypothetical protein